MAYGPQDCLISQGADLREAGEHAVLMQWSVERQKQHLFLHPYPRRGHANAPERSGFPIRPRPAMLLSEEVPSVLALRRMNEVTARVQELGEALDMPTTLWEHLRAAWDRAEKEEDPRMAEIVRQARELMPTLKNWRDKIRRVLRRTRELTPLDRVQEMDRSSMRWLSRQPGRTIAERAGAGQRILAVVRHENFDTLENRVAHSYLRLVGDVGREWLAEHPKALGSARYLAVQAYVKFCKSLAQEVAQLGVGIAPTDITPNYVLLEDQTYRAIREAWEKLLRREKALDDLWAWQAQTWTDFSVLAIVLALHEMEGAELIAQSPIRFREEAVQGIWFEQERPIAVFWLRRENRVVEVMARPEEPGTMLIKARAHVALRISQVNNTSAFPHRVAVWTPHAFKRLDVEAAAHDASHRLAQLRRLSGHHERIRHGLILTPAHYTPQVAKHEVSGTFIHAVALDGAGESLAFGRAAIRDFLTSDIWTLA